MKTVEYDTKYDEKAGRLELFIRIVWAIPCSIVLMVLALIGEILMALQFLYILVLGKRNRMMFDWTKKYIAYCTKFSSYLYLLTDERCPIMPED
ncbi:MAG: DUF4389 domain-containing protein [Candidatus ainarchaeum sp.]|nr:DUF4389 domain-containing protein [Candidatus ainarchaeum sp.]